MTLAEVLLAVGLVAVALLGLASVFIHGLQLGSGSHEVTAATEVAREVLERVRAAGYPALGAPASYDGAIPTAQNGQGFPPYPYPFKEVGGRVYTVFVRTETRGLNLTGVEVRVSWGPRSSVSLEALVHP